jgi:hypothetical protein
MTPAGSVASIVRPGGAAIVGAVVSPALARTARRGATNFGSGLGILDTSACQSLTTLYCSGV